MKGHSALPKQEAHGLFNKRKKKKKKKKERMKCEAPHLKRKGKEARLFPSDPRERNQKKGEIFSLVISYKNFDLCEKF
jgi:hypothetical protein